jgi:glyoxylase-like metal-dependent hydrolase (beta-lactamase superfamily II)
MNESTSTLYFRQLLAGRDVARVHPAAAQMANFLYLIGDPSSRRCLVIDPSWDPFGALALAEEDGYQLVGAVCTHTHPDHIGGNLYGMNIPGVADLHQRLAPNGEFTVYVHALEAEGLQKNLALPPDDLTTVTDGDSIELGETSIQIIHTPGHTPGGICLLVAGHLVSGDTLFVGSCGRTDLPGSDVDKMYHSLKEILAKLPDDTRVFPGHDYGPTPSSTIAEEKEQNHALRVPDLQTWRRFMG